MSDKNDFNKINDELNKKFYEENKVNIISPSYGIEIPSQSESVAYCPDSEIALNSIESFAMCSDREQVSSEKFSSEPVVDLQDDLVNLNIFKDDNFYIIKSSKNVAYNDYKVIIKNNNNFVQDINFQTGSILENINGITMECLITICLDRLYDFQNSEFRCSENEYAIHYLESALINLNNRTDDRKKRGVHGKYEK